MRLRQNGACQQLLWSPCEARPQGPAVPAGLGPPLLPQERGLQRSLGEAAAAHVWEESQGGGGGSSGQRPQPPQAPQSFQRGGAGGGAFCPGARVPALGSGPPRPVLRAAARGQPWGSQRQASTPPGGPVPSGGRAGVGWAAELPLLLFGGRRLRPATLSCPGPCSPRRVKVALAKKEEAVRGLRKQHEVGPRGRGRGRGRGRLGPDRRWPACCRPP